MKEGKQLVWLREGRVLGDRSSPETEAVNIPEKSCVTCISYIEGVCPRITLNMKACGAYNIKEFYELCTYLKTKSEGD